MKLLLLILSLCSITCFSQSTKDSLNCYTLPESRKIASRLTWANSCDTLLEQTTTESLNKDTIIRNDSTTIRNQAQMIVIKAVQITNRDQTIKNLTGDLKEVKTMWGVSVLVLLGIIFLHK